MKTNKLKSLSIVVCCAFTALWAEIKCMEDNYQVVEKIYDSSITYSSQQLNYTQGTTLSTHAQRPTAQWTQQNSLIYTSNPRALDETVLKRVIPGQDGRRYINNTTSWPHSIHAQITMVFNGDEWGGSGSMVGPHHLLTCGHNVYSRAIRKWAESITIYPALNNNSEPFGNARATKVYAFNRWVDSLDDDFDMALIILDHSIGHYTGWGSFMSLTDEVLSRNRVEITGYPKDVGNFKQMWTMQHIVRRATPEKFDYEIDTNGGQSGSAIWVNHSGAPGIIGVHTQGTNTPDDPNTMNSGVRLSRDKFNALIGIFSKTYVINLNIPVVPVVNYNIPINPHNRLPIDFNPELYIAVNSSSLSSSNAGAARYAAQVGIDCNDHCKWGTYHFTHHGLKEGRDYFPKDFNPELYIAVNSSSLSRSNASAARYAAQVGIDCDNHYLWGRYHFAHHGWREGRRYN